MSIPLRAGASGPPVVVPPGPPGPPGPVGPVGPPGPPNPASGIYNVPGDFGAIPGGAYVTMPITVPASVGGEPVAAGANDSLWPDGLVIVGAQANAGFVVLFVKNFAVGALDPSGRPLAIVFSS